MMLWCGLVDGCAVRGDAAGLGLGGGQDNNDDVRISISISRKEYVLLTDIDPEYILRPVDFWNFPQLLPVPTVGRGRVPAAASGTVGYVGGGDNSRGHGGVHINADIIW